MIFNSIIILIFKKSKIVIINAIDFVFYDYFLKLLLICCYLYDLELYLSGVVYFYVRKSEVDDPAPPSLLAHRL